MKGSIRELNINFERESVTVVSGNTEEILGFGDPRAFEVISKAWLRSGWDTKYVYGFTWLGRPIIQLPEDIIRIQEVIYDLKPDLVIETGIAHGGGLVLYASILSAIGGGHVVGVDIDIRSQNRTEIEQHFLADCITLIEGSSVEAKVLDQVRPIVERAKRVLVILDSNHSCEHVLMELNAYGAFVTKGSYIVATDGIMQDLVGAPRSNSDWDINNPQKAVELFLGMNNEFEIFPPEKLFNEGQILEEITYWPNAWLKKVK